MIAPFVGAWFFVPNLRILLPYQFFTPFLELNYYITSVLGKQVSKRNFSSPYM